MKKILFLLTVLVVTSFSFAQAPQGINYQGVARNNIGAAISKQNISVQFTILQSGVTKYQENQTTQTDTFGLYTLVIGNPSATVTNGTFASISWAGGNLSIQIGIDPTGGSSYTIVATTQLQSVPYALYAGSAGSSSGSITSITTNSAQIVATGTSTVNLDLATVGTATTVGSSTTIPQISIDQYGRITSVSNQTFTTSGGTITSLTVGAGLTPTGTITTSGSIDLPTFATLGSGGTVGSATAIPVITYDQYGRITGVSTQTVSGGDIVIAGTGLTSTSLSNTVTLNAMNGTAMWNANQLQGINISTMMPLTGQVLTYTAGNWAPASIGGTLPAPTIGSLLYSDPSNAWAATNPSNISSDGNSITVINTTTVGTAGTFSVNGAGSNSPALQVTSNSSTGYGIKVDNLSGAAIVANSNGPYAIEGNITQNLSGAGGTGAAIVGQVENNSNGNAIVGYVDGTSTGKAGYFIYNKTTGTDTVFKVVNLGTGYSGSFNGGAGLQTDQIKITGTSSNPPSLGYVLTSDALGNGTWQAASSGNSWLTTGNNALATDFLGTNNSQPLIFKTSGNEAMRIDNVSNWLGIGTGTASLISQLDVNGNIHLNTGKILMGPVGGINNGYTGLYGNPSTGDLILAVFQGGASGGSLGSSNSFDAVTIKGTTAKVGIGNSNPQAHLDVPGKIKTDTIQVTTSANAGYVLTSDGSGNGIWQSLGPAPLISASNGLTVTTGSVELGGTLTNNTNITQNANNMLFNATSGNFQIANSGVGQALSSINSGTGQAGNFYISNGGNNSAAFFAGTAGMGQAGLFQISNAGNGQAAINAITNGIGQAGNFQINNTSDGQPALYATTNGSGASLQATSTGTVGTAGLFQVTVAGNGSPAINANTTGAGQAGFFTINNTSNGSNAIIVTTNGTGTAANIQNNGTAGGAGNFQITTTSNNNTALNASTNGLGNAGQFAISNISNSQPAVYATTNGANGYALEAVTSGTASIAGYFTNNNAGNGQPAIWATTSGTGGAINATTSGTSGTAGTFQTTGASNTAPTLYASTASSGAGSGPAATFTNTSASNNAAALYVGTNGVGNSGVFSGGTGLKTDNFQMTTITGTVVAGSVLTASTTAGNAMWAAPINFSGSGSITTTIPSASVTPITFASTDYASPGGSFNGTVFTAPAAGIYHISAAVTFSATATLVSSSSFQLQIEDAPSGTIKTSIETIPTGAIAGTLFQNKIGVDIQLGAGQQIQIGAYLSPSTSLSVYNQISYTYFTGHIIH